VGVVVHPADIHYRDGTGIVSVVAHLIPALAKFGDWTIEIVARAAEVTGSQFLPRRRFGERTLAGRNRNRRLAKDFETSITGATIWIYIASKQLIIRRLASAWYNLRDSGSDI
jgi:hypothetical protein